MTHSTAAGDQGAHVPDRLRSLQPAERRAHGGDVEVLRGIRRDDEEESGVRTTLVQLARRMEVAWSESQRGRDPERATPGPAHSAQDRFQIIARRQVGQHGQIVAGSRGPTQMPPGSWCAAPRAPRPLGAASSARARAFASSTSGWSNALTPSWRHSSHVAYSQRRNSRPRSSGSAEKSSTTCTSPPSPSPTRGMTPEPFFPELSATSCSIHLASEAIGAGGRRASLSRPAAAATAMVRPNARAASDVGGRGTLEQGRAVDAGERRGQHPHDGKGRIPAADVGGVREHRPKPALPRQPLERAPRVGDGDELPRLRAGGEVVVRGQRFDGRARIC